MPVKDLYYQKYLKYKNKYLNLLNQIGGSPPNQEGPIEYKIDKDKIIITYNPDNKGSPIPIFYKLNDEFIRKKNLTSIQLINIVKLIDNNWFRLSIMLPALSMTADKDILARIETLIFDKNDLKNVSSSVLTVIGQVIKLFPNVSTLSFISCNLDEKSANKLKKVLPKKNNLKVFV